MSIPEILLYLVVTVLAFELVYWYVETTGSWLNERWGKYDEEREEIERK